MIYRFREFEFQEERYQLRRWGTRIRVEPRILEVLAYLVQNRDRVVTKDELIGSVWRDADVGDSVLSRAVSMLRATLGDVRGGAPFIETVYGRGYRFVASVEEDGHVGAGPVPGLGRDASSLRRKPPEPTHHAREAGTGPDAAGSDDRAFRAAGYELPRLAHEEAARRLVGLLRSPRVSEAADPRQRCRLLIRLSEAEASQKAFDRARSAALESARLARGLGAADLLGRAALAYGESTPLLVKSDAVATGLVQEALGALPEKDGSLRARLLARLSGTEVVHTELDERAALVDAALAMARRLEEPATLASVLRDSLAALDSPQFVERCVEMSTEVIEIASAVGDKRLQLDGHRSRISQNLVLGAIDAVDRDLAAMEELSEALGQPRWVAMTRAIGVMRAVLAGRFEVAEAFAEEAIAAIPSGGEEALIAMVCIGNWLREREQAQVVVEFFEPLIARYPYVRASVSSMLCDLGMEATAHAHLDDMSQDDFARVPRDLAWITTMVSLAETSVLSGALGHAPVLYEHLLPFEGRIAAFAGLTLHGPVACYLGRLAASMGRWRWAEAHFCRSQTQSEAIGALPFEARTQLAHSEMLNLRGRTSDARRARRRAETALATAERLGMLRLRRQARSFLGS